jgi:hypothetical protein
LYSLKLGYRGSAHYNSKFTVDVTLSASAIYQKTSPKVSVIISKLEVVSIRLKQFIDEQHQRSLKSANSNEECNLYAGTCG